MFEGWVSELLASYLGHFLDVKREQLRVSLWNGGHSLSCPMPPELLGCGQNLVILFSIGMETRDADTRSACVSELSNVVWQG